jgi:hypothetical protein
MPEGNAPAPLTVAAHRQIPPHREGFAPAWAFICPACLREDSARRLGPQLCTCGRTVNVGEVPTAPAPETEADGDPEPKEPAGGE